MVRWFRNGGCCFHYCYSNELRIPPRKVSAPRKVRRCRSTGGGWVWVASVGSSDLKPEEAHLLWKDTQKYWLETALGSRNTCTPVWQLTDVRTWSARPRAHAPQRHTHAPSAHTHTHTHRDTHTPQARAHTHTHAPTTSVRGGARAPQRQDTWAQILTRPLIRGDSFCLLHTCVSVSLSVK